MRTPLGVEMKMKFLYNENMIRIDRFRMIVVSRVLLLCVSIFLLFYLLEKPEFFMVKIMLGMIILYQIYGLILFVEKTNRELNRFFESIQDNDFTRSFSNKSFGESFDNLKKSFEQVTRKFLKLRSEKEAQFHYLQTVVKHVGTGLISFKADGEVGLINTAAKQLFNIENIKNIKSLEAFSKPMVEKMFHLKPGENASIKIKSNRRTLYLSINAVQFKIKNELYTLASFQDIQPEIEREQMTKELEIAWSVQKSLLPGKNPDIPGFDIAGMCTPAKEVGGDYYDFIPVGENKPALVIGDVSGKGIPASFYMTLTKGFVQSHMTENASPKEVLVKVNELLYNTIDRRSFVTMFVVVLDREAKKAVCARAGHNAVFHYSGKTGEMNFIKPEGIALGLRKTSRFKESIRECEIHLDDNDWLILYTDGLTDAVDAGSNEFGEQRLIQTVKKNVHKSAEDMVETIFKKIRYFSGGSDQFDDMTLIAVKKVEND
jgi:serine phosphatase RsbU (regulator of sigma subunit)